MATWSTDALLMVSTGVTPTHSFMQLPLDTLDKV